MCHIPVACFAGWVLHVVSITLGQSYKICEFATIYSASHVNRWILQNRNVSTVKLVGTLNLYSVISGMVRWRTWHYMQSTFGASRLSRNTAKWNITQSTEPTLNRGRAFVF